MGDNKTVQRLRPGDADSDRVPETRSAGEAEAGSVFGGLGMTPASLFLVRMFSVYFTIRAVSAAATT